MKKNNVALLIKASVKQPYVSEVYVQPKNGKRFTLGELQEFVKGDIEILTIGGSDDVLIVNGEGKLENLPTNVSASEWYGQTVVGDVLLTNKRLIR